MGDRRESVDAEAIDGGDPNVQPSDDEPELDGVLFVLEPPESDDEPPDDVEVVDPVESPVELDEEADFDPDDESVPVDEDLPRLSVLKKPDPLNVTPTGVKTFLTGSTSPESG